MSRILQMSAVLLAASLFSTSAHAQSTDEGLEAETQELGPKDNKTINRGGGRSGGGKAANNNTGNRNKKKKKRKGPKLVGPFAKGKYPTQERLRPLVLPDGMGEVGLGIDYTNIASTDFVNLGAGFGFGIGDKVEVGLATGLALVPDVAWTESVTLRGHYLAVDGKKFDWAPGVLLPISFQQGAPFGVVLDLPGRLLVGDRAFLYFGNGAIPITISPDFALSIVGNGGVGVQFSKITALMVGLNVFDVLAVNPAGDPVVSGVWEVLNVDATLQFTPSDTVDVGLRAGVTNVWEQEGSLAPSAGVFGAVRF